MQNARAPGRGLLTRGRRREWVTLTELPAGERAPVLRAFPRQVPGGVRFFGLPPDPEAFAAAAPRCPVFRLDPLSPSGSALQRQSYRG